MKYTKYDILGFETDTVWGIGAHPLNEETVGRIYEIKGRDKKKPLILMSNKIENLLIYINNIPNYADGLIKKFFPGGLTLIFEKSKLCPDYVTSGNSTVGIRIPNHKGFYNIAENFEGNVLATTSLNFSNELPVKNYNEAVSKFGEKVKIIEPEFNEKTGGRASTVVLCTEKAPKILRRGDIYI